MSLTIGQAIWSAVKPIIKIYLIIGSGFLLARLNILSVEATRSISDIVLALLLPCLSFNKIVANIEGEDIKEVGIICLSSVLIFGTGLFFAYVVRRFLPVPKQWQGGILAGGMFPNISDLPIAYLQTMDQGLIFTEEEGNKGVADVIIFMTMFLICVFNLGGFRLIEMDFKYNDVESAVYDEQQTKKEENSSSRSSLTPPAPAHHSLHDYILPSESQSVIDQDSSVSPAGVQSNVSSQPVAIISENQLKRRPTRRGSISSVRALDLRELPPQDVNDLIHEYSNVDQFGKKRRNSADNTSLNSNSSVLQRVRNSDLTRIVTSDATVTHEDIKQSGSALPPWIRNFILTKHIVFFLKNCLRPCPMSVILALIIAFIPWVKALFVTSSHTPHIRQAPDDQPALSFIMDFTGYVGAASVPFGLLLLGATLGRLKLKKLYPGFWKSAALLVILRQCIMPIFGVLWCDRLVKAGWLSWENDKMLLFVIVIDWALPTMTTIIYFTASYTPVDATETVQIDCVSFFLMLQYPLLVVSLPFLVTYFLKVQMKM